MIFFKAEANANIGGGHLKRALRLADECSKANEEVKFIFSESDKLAIQEVIEKGYSWKYIDKNDQYNPYPYLDFIPKGSLIIFDTDDSAFYSGKIIETLRMNNIKTGCFTITDYFEISTDLLINPNIIAETQCYKAKAFTKKLLGPKYMIFDKKFWNINESTKFNKNEFPYTLLLVFGNADYYNLTTYLINAIDDVYEFLKKVIVVVGPLNRQIKQINKQIEEKTRRLNIELHFDTDNIIDIYRETDLAITSAGMAMWEMALFCIPQLVIASSDREKHYSDYLCELGYIYKLGNYNELHSINEMKIKIYEVFKNNLFKDVRIKDFSEVVNPRGIHSIVNEFIDISKK